MRDNALSGTHGSPSAHESGLAGHCVLALIPTRLRSLTRLRERRKRGEAWIAARSFRPGAGGCLPWLSAALFHASVFCVGFPPMNPPYTVGGILVGAFLRLRWGFQQRVDAPSLAVEHGEAERAFSGTVGGQRRRRSGRSAVKRFMERTAATCGDRREASRASKGEHDTT